MPGAQPPEGARRGARGRAHRPRGERRRERPGKAEDERAGPEGPEPRQAARGPGGARRARRGSRRPRSASGKGGRSRPSSGARAAAAEGRGAGSRRAARAEEEAAARRAAPCPRRPSSPPTLHGRANGRQRTRDPGRIPSARGTQPHGGGELPGSRRPRRTHTANGAVLRADNGIRDRNQTLFPANYLKKTFFCE